MRGNNERAGRVFRHFEEGFSFDRNIPFITGKTSRIDQFRLRIQPDFRPILQNQLCPLPGRGTQRVHHILR